MACYNNIPFGHLLVLSGKWRDIQPKVTVCNYLLPRVEGSIESVCRLEKHAQG